MLDHNAYLLQLTSSHHTSIISPRQKKNGKYRIKIYAVWERKWPHSLLSRTGTPQFITLCFIVLRRCYVFDKWKARPSSKKKITAHLIVILALLQCNISRVCLSVVPLFRWEVLTCVSSGFQASLGLLRLWNLFFTLQAQEPTGRVLLQSYGATPGNQSSQGRSTQYFPKVHKKMFFLYLK